MSYEFGRNIQDAAFSVSKALPAANATATSDDIDLGAIATNSNFPERCELEVKVPATTAHTAGILTLSLQNGSSAAPTTALNNISFTVASSTAGGSETIKRFRLPPDVARYVNVKCVNSTSTDGDSTGVSYTVKLLF